MKHAMDELYTVYNSMNNKTKLVTLAFVQENNIPTPKYTDRHKHLVYARACSSHLTSKKPLRALDAHEEIKLVYLFGESTWFDTQEELDAYREEYHAQRAQEIARNKMKKEIAAILDTMSTAEIEVVLASLQK